jgi:hypothetical protein
MMVKQGGGLLMMGIRMLSRSAARCLIIAIATLAALLIHAYSVHAVVVISDGFGDADRDNDGVIEFSDTDINDSGTYNVFTGTPPNATGDDAALANRGLTEVTAATDPSDIGIIWSGLRSFDTTANIAKGKLRIINDSVATGSESASNIHNDGLALGVETRGSGSPIMGWFQQSVDLGPTAGDKVIVSVDFRGWAESNNPTSLTVAQEIRWGLFEDTDNELGSTAPYGDGFVTSPPGDTVMWGRDDGNWFKSTPGAEGDKGIHVGYEFGDPFFANEGSARIRWENNVAGINGTNPTVTGSDGRILEGLGVSATPGAGGDVGTVATPQGTTPDGPGGDFSSAEPATLRMEIIRLADGRVEIASFINGTEILRDDIKTTDTGYDLLGPPAFSYDYVAFRPSADFDYAIDNFKVEVINASVAVPGDYNGNGKVDAADYVVWRNGGPLLNEVDTPGTINAADYTEWRLRFGNPGSGSALAAAVPEPTTGALLAGGLVMLMIARRDPWRCRLRKKCT